MANVKCGIQNAKFLKKKLFKREQEEMNTFWIGMMAATFVLGTPIVGVIYVMGKIGFSWLESTSYITLKTYLKAMALGSGAAFLVTFFR